MLPLTVLSSAPREMLGTQQSNSRHKQYMFIQPVPNFAAPESEDTSTGLVIITFTKHAWPRAILSEASASESGTPRVGTGFVEGKTPLLFPPSTASAGGRAGCLRARRERTWRQSWSAAWLREPCGRRWRGGGENTDSRLWCDPSCKGGRRGWKTQRQEMRGRRQLQVPPEGAAGSCKYPLKGLLTKAYCLGLWVMFERPCRVLQKQRFTPTQGGNESPVDTACKFAARCKHGYSQPSVTMLALPFSWKKLFHF